MEWAADNFLNRFNQLLTINALSVVISVKLVSVKIGIATFFYANPPRLI
jgi:hypothetical protein